jgi:hypothetical protein
MSSAGCPSSSYSTLPAQRGDLAHRTERLPSMEGAMMQVDVLGPKSRSPRSAAPKGRGRDSVQVREKAPPSPASPPDSITPPGRLSANPSMRALPLICTPWPSTSTWTSSGSASARPRRRPAARESSMSARSVTASRNLDWLKCRAVMTISPSVTPPVPISPAVVQPASSACGKTSSRISSRPGAVRGFTEPKTSTSWGAISTRGARSVASGIPAIRA